MRRLLPLIAVVFILIFLLPSLLNRKSSKKVLSSGDRAALTLDAADRIDAAEAKYRAAHGSYTTHLADLLAIDPKLSDNLTIGLGVDIDVGGGGKTYVVRATSDVLAVVRTKVGARVLKSCRALVNASGVDCPVPPGAATTGTTTVGTRTITTSSK